MKLFKALTVAVSIVIAGTSFAQSKPIVLTEKNSIALRGEVNENTVSKVQAFLMQSPEKDVYLYIDSPGGSVIDGLNLTQTLESTDKNVTCVANTAASMAFVILQSCKTRLVTNSALVMQHVASYGMQGQEPNNYTFAKLIHRIQREMEERQAKRIGMEVKRFRGLVRSDWWLFGAESVASNVADGVTSVTCDEKMSKGTTKEKVQVLFWTIDVVYSACPVISAPLSVGAARIGSGNDGEAQKELVDVLGSFNVRNTIQKLRAKGTSADEKVTRAHSVTYLNKPKTK